ncbi:MAG: hypothetical protein WBV93_19755, partial [Anaerobacillus sp.]
MRLIFSQFIAYMIRYMGIDNIKNATATWLPFNGQVPMEMFLRALVESGNSGDFESIVKYQYIITAVELLETLRKSD